MTELEPTLPANELTRLWPFLGDAPSLSITQAGAGLRVTSAAGTFHLRRRASGEALERELSVMLHLHAEGLPVPRPVSAGTGKSSADLCGLLVFLYPELPGAPYDNFEGSAGLARAKRLGGVLARMHLSLARFAPVVGFEVQMPEPDLVDRIIADGDAANVAEFRAVGARRRSFQGLPGQLIHRDFHAGNVLFENDTLSGLIDLDHLLIGPRLFDLCYCLLGGPLTAMVGSADKSGHWLDIVRAFTAGYQHVQMLRPIERHAFADMMIEIELIFMHWFRLTGEAHLVASIEGMIYWLDGARKELARAAGA